TFVPCSSRVISDSRIGICVDGEIVRVVAKTVHQRIEDGSSVEGKEIHQSAIRSETDRFVLVGQRAFSLGLTQFRSQLGADSFLVVCRPGIEDTCVYDGQSASYRRRAEAPIANHF